MTHFFSYSLLFLSRLMNDVIDSDSFIHSRSKTKQNRINEDDSALDAWNQYIKKLKAEEEVRIPKCASSPKLQHVSYKQYAPVA